MRLQIELTQPYCKRITCECHVEYPPARQTSSEANRALRLSERRRCYYPSLIDSGSRMREIEEMDEGKLKFRTSGGLIIYLVVL